jgi:hypothetical protein
MYSAKWCVSSNFSYLLIDPHFDMRTKLTKEKENIIRMIEKEVNKIDICRHYKCKIETLNKHLKLWGVVYSGGKNKILPKIPYLWTKDKCLEAAKQFGRKKDFISKHSGAYNACSKYGWLDDLNKLFPVEGNLKKRFIYCYEFEDNHAYVGITLNLESRKMQHQTTNTAVRKHILKTDSKFVLKTSNETYSIAEIPRLEQEKIDEYTSMGWIVLNKAKAGSLGGNNLIWTKEKCVEAAKKCASRSEFRRKFSGAWYSAKNNGWLNEIYKAYPRRIVHNKYWTKERCFDVAKTCNSRSKFNLGYPSAYNTARVNGWLEEIRSTILPAKKNRHQILKARST